MTNSPPLGLFQGYGIELEYMIVDAATHDVRPFADRVLRDDAGTIVSDVEHPDICWSNELVSHVVELKTNGPAAKLETLAAGFQSHIQRINERLADSGAVLMPTAMHPWMNPDLEMKLWPYEYGPVYETFHRIFDCRGHGWANLQSMHINLPFKNDEEFGRLHAAVRLLLPFLPALAASSPWQDGKLTGLCDTRLQTYRQNSRRIPEVAGRIIPEARYTERNYQQHILQPMYAAIAAFDTEGILQEEFLNARGAIARFTRGAIEIRVLDVQECPQADLAIAEFVAWVLQQLVAERWTTTARQQVVDIDSLAQLFERTVRQAEASVIEETGLLQHFGFAGEPLTTGRFWQKLLQTAVAEDALSLSAQSVLGAIVNEGCLARRLLNRLGNHPNQSAFREVAGELSMCLANGRQFRSTN